MRAGLVVALLVGLGLAGCGKVGDLRLPPEEAGEEPAESG